MSTVRIIPGFTRYAININEPHNIIRLSDGHVMALHDNGHGYRCVNLINDAGFRKHVKLHRILACMFIRNDDPMHKTYVDHKDKHRDHNQLTNLRWATPSENSLNKSSSRGVQYQFVGYLPEDSVRVHAFRQHTLREMIYYSLETNQFYLRVGESEYRVMHQNIRCRKTFALARSTENKLVRLYNDEVAAHIDLYTPIDVEEEQEASMIDFNIDVNNMPPIIDDEDDEEDTVESESIDDEEVIDLD